MIVRIIHTEIFFGGRFVNCEKLEGRYLVIFLDFHAGCRRFTSCLYSIEIQKFWVEMFIGYSNMSNLVV
jgi:hypothetical protein